MAFLGESFIKIDDKGRLRIPTALKEGMSEEAQNKFVVNRGFENCLTLYPYDVWQVVKAKIDVLNTFNRENREFVRRFYSGATEMTLDAGDRINISKQLLEYAGISKEIVLTPVKDYFEIWDSKKYNDLMNQQDSSSFEDLAERVLGNLDL
jgi:MraZ protein